MPTVGSTMQTTVIRFDLGGQRFNYRVVGVAIHDGTVLLQRAGDEPFWTLTGGRAEIGEAAEHTIRREMREELSTDVEVVRLLWFVENFFDYDGVSYHEIALYFLIRFPLDSRPLAQSAFQATDGDTRLQFQWFPLQEEKLANLPLVPSFLASGLRQLPTSVTHIVHRDALPQA
jgi:ADP-ribose pyrophosphatase YjhB (NUDIX family)